MGKIAVIIVITLLLAAALVVFRRRIPCSAPLIAAAVAAAGLACCLCVFAAEHGAISFETPEAPEETVTRFFDAVCGGDHAAAYACLDNYADLGLQNLPEDAAAAEIYAALRGSFSYTLSGAAEVSGFSARQSVVLRCLDVPAFSAALHDRVNEMLEGAQEGLAESEIIDENGDYLPAFTDALFADAVRSLLAEADDFTAQTTLDLALTYSGSEWLLKADAALLAALCGGAV